jgi:NADH dehydrogenase
MQCNNTAVRRASLRSASTRWGQVGAGPTGVELAGALVELARTTLSRDFRSIDPDQTRIMLIEAASRVVVEQI